MKLVQTGCSLEVTAISVSPHHFRDTTVNKRLEQLADSLKKVGQVHPVSVVKRNDTHELINGHRRWKAAKHAGMKSLRADIYEFEGPEVNDRALQQQAVARFLMAANMSEPLVPLERARYYDDAMQQLGLTIDQLAEIHSVTPEEIAEDLKFVSLSPKVVTLVQGAPDKFTQAHLKILAEYANPGGKKAWRLTEDEQEKLAVRLIRQEDKRETDDPRVFDKKVREVVAERRRTARDLNRQRKRERDEAGVLRDFLKLLERADKAVRDLGEYDFDAKPVNKTDKHRIMARLFELSEAITTVATEKVGKLAEVKTARREAVASA